MALEVRPVRPKVAFMAGVDDGASGMV